jgi:hypothetical protein
MNNEERLMAIIGIRVYPSWKRQITGDMNLRQGLNENDNQSQDPKPKSYEGVGFIVWWMKIISLSLCLISFLCRQKSVRFISYIFFINFTGVKSFYVTASANQR